MLRPLFQAAQVVHFHGWIFGFAPFRFHYTDNQVTVSSKFYDFLPTLFSISLGCCCSYFALTNNITGFESNLLIVSIFQNGLLLLMFIMYMGTTLWSYVLRSRFAQIIQDLNEFDQKVAKLNVQIDNYTLLQDAYLVMGSEWILYISVTVVGHMILYNHEPLSTVILQNFMMYMFNSTYILYIVHFVGLNVAIKRRFSALNTFFK